MLFYFFFAFLILNRWLSIISGLALLYLYITYTGVSSLSFPLSFMAQDCILLFVMGMAVSMACKSRKLVINRPAIYASIGAVMFVIIALDTVIDINLLKGWKTILYGLASSLIVLGLVQAEDKGRIIGGHNWMQLLGDSSYALYLIHYPLISLLCKLSLSIQLNNLGAIGAVIAYLAIFGTCLISSVIFHLWIEKPLIAYFRCRYINPIHVVQQNPPANVRTSYR